MIRRSPRGITLEELNDRWVNTSISDGETMHRNTFRRYCESIEDMFDIRIQCNRRDFSYYIDDGSDFHGNSLKHWLLSTMTVASVVGESRQIQGRILLENVPSGELFLSGITQAMEHGHTLLMRYKKFTDAQSYETEVEPYCLKLFHQRWYLLANKIQEATVKTYSLDRIQSVKETSRRFSVGKDFDAKDYFRYDYGVFHGKPEEVQDILVRTYKGLGDYYRTLPLHASQKEVASTGTYVDFSYRLCPTYDFMQELMSQGENLEVLSPQSLREKIMQKLSEALSRYNKGNSCSNPKGVT